MNRRASRPTKPSLLTRISEAKSQASTTVDRSYHETPRQETFAERYRGTEFESHTPVMVVHQDHISRGRSFVIVVGTAVMSVLGMLLVAAAG